MEPSSIKFMTIQFIIFKIDYNILYIYIYLFETTLLEKSYTFMSEFMGFPYENLTKRTHDRLFFNKKLTMKSQEREELV